MVNDPYSVLGISRDADKEEIKRAYRRKAKEHHPDLHPNDPKAAEKMNEINEAYDMLCNPDKYKQREQNRGGYGTQGGAYQRSTYDENAGQGYGYGDFWGFGFEDIFGSTYQNQSIQKPTRQPGDSEEINKVVDFIRMDRYDFANQILNQIVSSERNGRWHYLSALTNHGLGNQIRALEEIQKAMQMEPNNQTYMQVYNSMRRNGTQYQYAGQDFQKAAESMHRYCMGFCALQFFCTFCRCC